MSPFSSISSSLRAPSVDRLEVGRVAPLVGHVVALLERGHLLGEVADARAQLARLALELPAQRLVLRRLVARQQILQALVRVRELLAERRQILEPLAAHEIVEQQDVALELGGVARREAVELGEPSGRRLGAQRRQRGRLLAQQPFEPIGDARERGAQRLAERALAPVVVDQAPEQREVRLLGLVDGGQRRETPGRRLAGLGASLGPAGPCSSRSPRSPSRRSRTSRWRSSLSSSDSWAFWMTTLSVRDEPTFAPETSSRSRASMWYAMRSPAKSALAAGSHSVRPCAVFAPCASRSSVRCSGAVAHAKDQLDGAEAVVVGRRVPDLERPGRGELEAIGRALDLDARRARPPRPRGGARRARARSARRSAAARSDTRRCP